MKILEGFSVEEMQSLVGDAMEPVLRPLVYSEPLHLVQHHRERGESVYVVSATLQEIVEHIAEDLGFDGAIGSTCEIVDGGTPDGPCVRRTERARHAHCTSWRRRTDSISRRRPRTPTRTPTCRSWRRSATRRRQSRPAAEGGSRAPARGPRSLHRPCGLRTPARGSRRSGSPQGEVETLAEHFLDAERRGLRGHGLSRIEWLETWEELPLTRARPRDDEPGYERWDGERRARLPDARGGRRRPAREPPRACACRRLHADVPDGVAGLLGAAARGRRAGRRC